MKTFGESDKLYLLTGIFTVLGLLAAVTGVLVWRSRWLALGVTTLLGLVGLAAALTDRSQLMNTFERVAPSLAALIISVAALAWFIHTLGLGLHGLVPGTKSAHTHQTPENETPAERSAVPVAAKTAVGARHPHDEFPRARPKHDESSAPAGFDRRQFLLATLATGAVAAVGVGSSQLVTGVGSRSRDSIALPTAADKVAAISPGYDFGVKGLTPHMTSNKDFYRVDTALSVPQVDAGTWTLKITGMVDEELEFSFEDILNMPLVERRITLACVSNEVGGHYAGNATWLGVKISDLLEQAGVSSDADAVKSTSADGMTIGTPLDVLTDDRDALLAIGMNGVPLPLEHGFPARMVVPGLYGYVSATKWVTELEVSRFDDFSAYWTEHGFSAEAPIKTFSRIDVPKSFAQLSPGKNAIAGIAWAQHTGIEKVEVQIDDGEWHTAKLADEDTTDTWRQWLYPWDATDSGLHQIRVRATDTADSTQTSRRVPPRPDGATGWHSVSVTVT